MHRNFNRIRHYSSGSDGSDQDYGYAHSKEALQSIQQMQGNVCIRCHKRVYPTEKVEIGVIMHKNCFKCMKCSVTLTLNSFVLARSVEQGPKDVYCKPHAPKLISCSKDNESMDIRNAMNAQRMHKNFMNSQIRLPPGMEGWQYDPKAMVFEHAKELHERNRLRRPPTHDGRADDVEYESGAIIRRLRSGMENKPGVKELASTLMTDPPMPQHRSKFPVNSDYMEPNALWSPKAVEDPWNPNFYPDRRSNGSSQGGSSGHDSGFNEPIYAPLPVREDPIYAPLPARQRDPSNPYDNGGSYGNHMAGGERIYESLNLIRQAADLPPSLPPRLPPPFGNHPDRNYQDRSQPDRYRMADTHGEYYQPQDHRGHGRSGKGPRRAGYENVTLPQQHAPPPPPDLPQKAYFQDQAFIAQKDLENKQRLEHGELFRNFEQLQEQEIMELEKQIKKQMEKAVEELFIQMDSGMFQGDLNVEKMRIEQHFQRMKEERMNSLLDKLNAQERIRVDDMIDKQTREMLQLIDKKVPAKLPSPKPPRKKKSHLYSGAQVFDDVDFTAMQVAKQEQGSISELVYDLTRTCKNQLEKARAIFRWITFKNLNQMIFHEDISEDSPYYFLKGIKYGLESYHELFKRLCSYAGLPVKIIRGVSKSAGYRPGMPFSDSSYKNTWGCIYIEDSWRFVDCHWGARHVKSPSDILDPSTFTYAMDEFFFLTDPEDFIYMHYPEEPEWQLLERPKSQDQFIALPVIKSHFFQYGLKLPTNMEAIIDSSDGLAEIVLKHSASLPLAFNTRLEQDGEELDGYCIHHNSGKETVFNLSLPRRGVFYFTLFACDTDKSDAYNNICAFRIKCLRVVNKPYGKFPKLPDGYGPTRLAEELGMSTEKYSEYYLVCNDEKMIMTIKFATPVKISQKLVCGKDEKGDEERKLDRYVFQRNRDHTFVSYLIRFPERGIYVFSVYAARRDHDSSVLEVACRYLIQCNAKASTPVRPYPLTQAYWLKCRLHEPTTGDLKLNKNVRFKIEVHNADAVAVIVKQQWYYLKKDENAKIWSGSAHTGKDVHSTVDVYARLKDHERDFYPLLEYKLVPED